MFFYPLTGGEAIVAIIVFILLMRWIHKENKKAEEERWMQELAQEQEQKYTATVTLDNEEDNVVTMLDENNDLLVKITSDSDDDDWNINLENETDKNVRVEVNGKTVLVQKKHEVQPIQ